METFLQRLEQQKAREREDSRLATLARLRTATSEHLAGLQCVVFGSVLKPGNFRKNSDVDIALFDEPAGTSIFSLHSRLEEAIGRNVDLVMLPECRLKEKILREGEIWTN